MCMLKGISLEITSLLGFKGHSSIPVQSSVYRLPHVCTCECTCVCACVCVSACAHVCVHVYLLFWSEEGAQCQVGGGDGCWEQQHLGGRQGREYHENGATQLCVAYRRPDQYVLTSFAMIRLVWVYAPLHWSPPGGHTFVHWSSVMSLASRQQWRSPIQHIPQQHPFLWTKVYYSKSKPLYFRQQ